MIALVHRQKLAALRLNEMTAIDAPFVRVLDFRSRRMTYYDMLLAGYSPAYSQPVDALGFGSLLGDTAPKPGGLALASLLTATPSAPSNPLIDYGSLGSALGALAPDTFGLSSIFGATKSAPGSLLSGYAPTSPAPQTPTTDWFGLATLGFYNPPPSTLLNAYAPLGSILGASAPVGWVAVRQRFEQFHRNLALTPQQVADGKTKRGNVVGALNRAYFGTSSETDNSFFVGSWAKDTAIRPPRDVDLYFLLPAAVYHRFQSYTGNRQSALLQEIRAKLISSYPCTDMSGDGQVVLVNFGSYCVEVVPAFALNTEGHYWICDANDGGSYKETAPFFEVSQLESADSANARNLRPLVRMLKAWQANCSVPIKSFHLELLASEFIQKYAWRLKDWFYFDWITRDFFTYLYYRANGSVAVPGTFEVISLGSDWQSRAQSAYDRAVKACDFERDNRVPEAGEQWQMIFGADIPRTI